MYKLLKPISIFNIIGILCFSTFVSPTLIQAQTYDPYIWQYQTSKNITNADDLKTNLESEVQKVISSGHLAPFRAIYGELNAEFYWYHRYDTIYTLAAAYPYLSPTLQASVKTYMQNEMQTYPLWNAALLDSQTGTQRNPDSLTASERGSFNYSNRPKLFALYALWLYANNTQDWTYIQNNWSNISNFYNANKAEVGKHYSSIAGAIGYARMAAQKSPADSTARSGAVSDITSGMNAGKTFATFGQNTSGVYVDLNDSWRREDSFSGYQFLDITPEIGRYFADDSSLKTKVLGTQTNEEYSLKRGEYLLPLWYMAQGPLWSRVYGEGSGNPVDARGMLFPLHAWVLKETPTQLRKYVDVPDALIGDYYYMQNLTRTLEAHGTLCWKDALTSSENCGAAPTTNPQPTSSATNTPPTATQTPVCKADINSDKFVDLSDYSILVSNFLKTTLSNPRADINTDGNVDLSDYSLLVSSFLKSCP